MLRFGAYTGDSNTAFKALESSLGGYQLAVVQKFYSWGDDPSTFVTAVAPRAAMMCIDLGSVTWAQIANGSQDSYINKMAAVSKAAGRPTYWRIGAEMNGNWESYFVTSSNAAACKSAFQHMASLMHAVTPNAKIVWCPNDSTSSGGADPASYYPGSASVDIIGIDSYSWQGAAMDSFFAPYYTKYSGIDPTKEVWNCETGCQNSDSNQGAWVVAAVKSTKFPKLTTIVYENSPGTAAAPWTLTSTSLAALKTALSSAPVPPPVPPPIPPTPSPGNTGFVAPVPSKATYARSTDSLSASAIFTNASGKDMTLKWAGITSRPPGGTHGGGPFDALSPIKQNVVVKAGQTLSVSASRPFKLNDLLGMWEIYATWQGTDGTWHDGPSTYVTVK